MIHVTEFAFTGYPVTDMARARAFYEGILNLRPATTFEHEGRQWIEYEVGAATLALSNLAQEQWKPSADGPALALEMEDFDAAIEKLREAGVTFLIEPMNNPTCRLAIISDPDGNSLAVHQRKSGVSAPSSHP